MHKSTLVFVGVCVALGGIFAAMFLLGSGSLTVRIPLAAAQASVDARLPVESRSLRHAYKLTRVKLAFDADGRAIVDCDFTVEVVGRVAAGRLVGRARPVYRGHAFYLEGLEVTHVDVARLEVASDDLERGRQFADRYSVRAAVLSDQQIVERAVELVVSDFLSKAPVYELDDATVKRRLARLMLREVRAEPEGLVAVLDPSSSW
jgi:hypothetical protein